MPSLPGSLTGQVAVSIVIFWCFAPEIEGFVPETQFPACFRSGWDSRRRAPGDGRPLELPQNHNMNTKIIESDYGFALGRMRVMEAALIDRPRYDRLVRAQTIAAFREVLSDTAYSGYLGGEETVNMEVALERAAEDNLSFLSEYCLDRWALDAFRLSAVAHNQKVICKHRLLGTKPADEELRSTGLTPADPSRWDKACAQLSDPEEIDAALDRLEQELVLEACRPSSFLAGFFSLRADTRNLQTLVRAKLFSADKRVFERNLLAGGSLKQALLVELFSKEWELVLARFRLTPFRRMVEEGVTWAQERGSLARMERLGREMGLAYARKARFITFGHEPLTGFYIVKENEITNLRQLYEAKAAGLEEDYCRELVALIE